MTLMPHPNVILKFMQYAYGPERSWEVVTEHAGFPDPAESLHDSNGVLDSFFALQFARARVRRRKVAIPAQPILDRQQTRGNAVIQQSKTTAWAGCASQLKGLVH